MACSLFCHPRLVGAALTCASLGAEHALQDCAPAPLFQLPMVPERQLARLIVSILIDGKPSDVLLDTGGFWSLINPSFAHRIYPSFRKSRNRGPRLASPRASSALQNRLVKVPSIQIGSIQASDVDFFVEPEGSWDIDTVATLGANWLSRMDVEIDPLDNKVRFYPRNNCGGDVGALAAQRLGRTAGHDRTSGQNLITIPIMLDGQEIWP